MKILKKTCLSIAALMCVASVCARNVARQESKENQPNIARQEIKANRLLAGANLLAYPINDDNAPALTPAPEGYTPFHMEHYGRHGSRFLIWDRDYLQPIQTLRDAVAKGAKLSARGEEVIAELEAINAQADGFYGSLTDLGAHQHQGIARRMVRNFPTIFCDSATIDAKSTVVIRCILSMTNELVEIASLRPGIKITQNSAPKFQPILNPNDFDSVAMKIRHGVNDTLRTWKKSLDNPTRIIRQLIDKPELIDADTAFDLAKSLFNIAQNQQSNASDTGLLDLFNDEEMYRFWEMNNVEWFVKSGYADLTQHRMPAQEKALVNDIITHADEAIASCRPSATMRFGHESMVLPLAAFLELNDCATPIHDINEISAKVQNYRIFPMAANIQLIFYRNPAGDILVKVLLNEREATLPIAGAPAPYYPWRALKAYYLDKLQK